MLKIILLILFINFSSIFAIAYQDPQPHKNLEKIIAEENNITTMPGCTAQEIELEQGNLCGTRVKNSNGKFSNAYLGIPFGETTAGKNRWRAPIPNSGWKGTFNE